MIKCKIYSYVVTGTGYFPFDMLRHDQAWPASEKQIGELATLKRYFESEHMLEHAEGLGLSELDKRACKKWSINIEGIRSPTVGRWRSFGWTVEMTPQQ